MSILANFDGFDFPIRESDGYWNLTAMCNRYNQRIDNFMRLKGTKDFLQSWEKLNSSVPYYSRSGGSRAGGATWGHPLFGEECLRWCQKKTSKSTDVTGCIYVLLDAGNNAYKIGFTTNLKARIKQHLGSNPFLEVVKTYEGVTIDFEETIHQALSKYRIPGSTEWYSKKPAVLRILTTTFNSIES